MSDLIPSVVGGLFMVGGIALVGLGLSLLFGPGATYVLAGLLLVAVGATLGVDR